MPFLYINEVSTVAAAYAFAGFATDPTHVSSTGTTAAKTAVAHAFDFAGTLFDIGAASVARATTHSGNGVVPQTLIDTVAG